MTILIQFIIKILILYSENIPVSISHCKMLLYLNATFRQNFCSQASSGQILWNLNNKKLRVIKTVNTFQNLHSENRKSRFSMSKLHFHLSRQ